MHGVVIVNKPGGMTSHDVVNRLRRIYGTKRVGHTGTLDPLATGVLVVCLGQATRIVEYLTASQKEYVAGVVFGVTTDSEDVTGQVLTETDAGGLTQDEIEGVLPRFRGPIQQIPPMVSAVHHEGKRLYELARQGVTVERAARPVEIYTLEMQSFHPGQQAQAALRVECSTGTYIRTLAADIGGALGVGGIMNSLLRTRVGVFNLAEAQTLEDLADHKENGTLAETLRSIPEALADWPHVILDTTQLSRLANGQVVRGRESRVRNEGEEALLLDESGEAVGLARRKGADYAPFKVFLQG